MTNKNSITINDCCQIMITGVTKVSAASPTQTVIEINDSCLIISGKDFEVKKLDVENNNLELFGKFEGMKFIPKKEKTNFFNKLFK